MRLKFTLHVGGISGTLTDTVDLPDDATDEDKDEALRDFIQDNVDAFYEEVEEDEQS